MSDRHSTAIADLGFPIADRLPSGAPPICYNRSRNQSLCNHDHDHKSDRAIRGIKVWAGSPPKHLLSVRQISSSLNGKSPRPMAMLKPLKDHMGREGARPFPIICPETIPWYQEAACLAAVHKAFQRLSSLGQMACSCNSMSCGRLWGLFEWRCRSPWMQRNDPRIPCWLGRRLFCAL